MAEKFFTASFEEKIIQAILSDPMYGEQVIEVFDPNHFELKHTQEVGKILKEYHEKYGCFPSVSLLENVILDKFKTREQPLVRDLCQKFIQKMADRPLNGDMDFVQEHSIKYFRTQTLKKVLENDVLPLIRDNNLDEILPLIEGAITKGSGKDRILDYLADTTRRFEKELDEKVPSPWAFLNGLLRGGWGKKRVITFIGPSGAGKSHFLVNVGIGALLAGKCVVHFTLELDDVETAKRYDAGLTGIEINDVPDRKDEVLERLSKSLPPGAQLHIKEYPMKYASVAMLKSQLGKMRLRGIIPDIVIIDHGNLVKQTASDGPYSNTWGEMKSMAQQIQVPVVTACQANRSGFNDDVLMPDKVAEDFAKIFDSDVVITIARNVEQKISGVGKLYIAKNRQGRDGQIMQYTIDTAKCKIDVMELPEDFGENFVSKIDQEKMVRDSLDEFLSKPIAQNPELSQGAFR